MVRLLPRDTWFDANALAAAQVKILGQNEMYADINYFAQVLEKYGLLQIDRTLPHSGRVVQNRFMRVGKD